MVVLIVCLGVVRGRFVGRVGVALELLTLGVIEVLFRPLFGIVKNQLLAHYLELFLRLQLFLCSVLVFGQFYLGNLIKSVDSQLFLSCKILSAELLPILIESFLMLLLSLNSMLIVILFEFIAQIKPFLGFPILASTIRFLM